ncbi:MAG: hypothetical protein JSU74_13180 [Candidatus Zixiibacteriota bacterium]|nr:MAG: hypothetical protein JSU74_13180 [candidate division Zixibacteria bacterium]
MSKVTVGLVFFALMIIILPLGYMQHEIGHVIAAKMADIPVTLSYYCVHEPPDLGARGYCLLCLGGPLATWSFAVAGFVVLFVGRRRNWWDRGKAPSIGQILLTCVALFSARSLLDGFFFIRTGFEGGAGDERMILDYLGVPLVPVVFLEIIVAAFIAVMSFRYISRGYRLSSVIGYTAGLFAGLFLWMSVVGPILLP